jgi:hypothetical protein
MFLGTHARSIWFWSKNRVWQCLSIGLDRGRTTPPPIKSGPGGFKRSSQVMPIEKTRMARCQPTWRGAKETSWPGLRYEAWGCHVPSMGPWVCPLLATLCVASSLALFAWGDAGLADGFCLWTQSYCRPMRIVGTILDTVAISCDVVGTSWEELGWHVNMCLLHPFIAPIRARRFASSVVTSWGYKACGHPCTNLRPLAWTPITSSPPSLCLKRKRGREIDLETGQKLLSL